MKYFMITLIFVSLAFGGSNSPKEDPVPSWQQSEALNIQIGSRDKNGALETYEAVFTVQMKGSDTIFEARTKSAGDAWAFVSFPENFTPGAKDGEYDWKCEVNGHITASGSFRFADDQRTLTIPKKQ
jgi:hypothetical protein